ncbi:hypothetical protein BGZ70_006271 [Mortierella alpina]|uniref:LysM domain-containing protein n=1 Tax=Mortierella alpina TaxID=64518 RepID=A0A9P6JE82_MORAP|nr:hypothetical protein BGZ70_006271 [Mortierella alpina]
MKFTLSLAVLAVVASQTMAVVPIPIKACTRNVTVLPTDIGCVDFAKANGCTFEQLLKWNDKLRPDCANLDVGHPLCVSITPGGGGNTTAPVTPPNPSAPLPPATSAGAAVPSGTPAATKPSSAAPAGVTTPPKSATSQNGAAGSQSSMVLAAAGVLVSVAYML